MSGRSPRRIHGPMHQPVKFSLVATLLVALLPVPAGAAGKGVPRVPRGRSLYDAPSPLPPGKHGDVIRAAELNTQVPGARAWKVLYRSTDIHENAVAVSGLVVAPLGKAPPGGRPVVTFAHGTTGLGRVLCSVLRRRPRQGRAHVLRPAERRHDGLGHPGAHRMIEAGYVVAATDFSGLGGPGFHQYLIGPGPRGTPSMRRWPRPAARDWRGAQGRGPGLVGGRAGGRLGGADRRLHGGGAEVLGAAALAPVNSAEQIRNERDMIRGGKKLPSMTGRRDGHGPLRVCHDLSGAPARRRFHPLRRLVDDRGGPEPVQQAHGQALDYQQAQDGRDPPDPQNEAAWARRTLEMALGKPALKPPVAVFQGTTI